MIKEVPKIHMEYRERTAKKLSECRLISLGGHAFPLDFRGKMLR